MANTLMENIDEAMARLKARSKPAKEKHRQDVAHIQEHRPELAKMLTEFTNEFGRLNYRVTLWPQK